MRKKMFWVCFSILLSGCTLLPLERNYIVKVETRKPTFDFQKVSHAKMVILPVRDFSDHYGLGYVNTTASSLVKEIKRKYPQVELADSETVIDWLEDSGKKNSYLLYADKCKKDRKYCVPRNEMLDLFANSGIDYVIDVTVGKLDIPMPNSAMEYSMFITIYNINSNGEAVYRASCDGAIYPDYIEESAAELMKDVVEEITRAIVAEM